jgi:hypothetical protein
MGLRIPPSPLERHARLLLGAYPAEYRAGRGREILGTLLEATPDGRGWPTLRDSASLVTGGLRARAGLNRRVPLGTALRQAAIIGVSLFCAHRAGDSLQDLAWTRQHISLLPPAADVVLLTLMAVLAWTGSRLAVLAAAVGTLAAGMWWDHSEFAMRATLSHGGVHVPGIGVLVRDAVPLAVPLAILVAVTGRSARPRFGWLALPGISLALTAVALPVWNAYQVHAHTLSLGVAAFLTVFTLPGFVSHGAVPQQDLCSVNSSSGSLEAIGPRWRDKGARSTLERSNRPVTRQNSARACGDSVGNATVQEAMVLN